MVHHHPGSQTGGRRCFGEVDRQPRRSQGSFRPIPWAGRQSASGSQLPAGARRFGVGVVSSTAASIDVLVKADAPVKESPGLVERLRRRLGFGEPS